MKNIVILTGAGVSKASGIDTFRDSNGLWENHKVDDVATLDGFKRDPELVQNFYNTRRKAGLAATPNAGHFALAKLQQKWTGEFTLITQNIDLLHEAAGSMNVIHMHGQLDKVRCVSCYETFTWLTDLTIDHQCPKCTDSLRPDIVWFGEFPKYMEKIQEKLGRADIFISIGTSGAVYPAAGFASLAKAAGATTILVNAEPIDSFVFDEVIIGKSEEILESVINGLLQTQ